MSSASLDAAALARKERLSQLKSLKRKQAALEESPSSNTDPSTSADSAPSAADGSPPSPTSKDVSHLLSGRNYSTADRAPKMGFASAPTEGATTLESLAEQIAEQTLEARRAEEAEEKPIDLFSLQPKKPNWDLKRDVEKKIKVLEAKTDAAIARLVRQGIEEKRREKEKKDGNGGVKGGEEEKGEGVEGDLAKMVREREREQEREEKDAQDEVDGEE